MSLIIPPMVMRCALSPHKFGMDITSFLFNMCKTYGYSPKTDSYWATAVCPATHTSPEIQVSFKVAIVSTPVHDCLKADMASTIHIDNIRVTCSDYSKSPQIQARNLARSSLRTFYTTVFKEITDNVSIINESGSGCACE